MKNNLKLIAVITLLVMHVYNVIRGISFYKYLFTNLTDGFRYGNGIHIVQQLFYILFQLFEIVLIIMFLTSAGTYKDKVYKLLRYVFVITFFLHVPYTLYNYISGDSYFYQADLARQLQQIAYTVVSTGCAVMFLMAKPQSQPRAVDLAEYELVSYTSMGHRFVHYLLDALFLIPVFLFWKEVLPVSRNEYLLQLLFTLLYLVYCFLSETIFRQTLGKIATGSCVTTIGYPLTAGRVLLRTLARLIPFDRLSFLFRANWHDKTTSTSVVYVDTWEKVFEDTAATDAIPAAK